MAVAIKMVPSNISVLPDLPPFFLNSTKLDPRSSKNTGMLKMNCILGSPTILFPFVYNVSHNRKAGAAFELCNYERQRMHNLNAAEDCPS